jgi:phosphoribosylanthranilate isomerase
MWIKICANTNLADAQLAAELGADGLGFVFAPSKRQVTVAQVAAIIPHLPATLETVAVVQSQDAEEIIDIVRSTAVTGVQLHGDVDLALVRALHSTFGDRVAITQTLHWSIGANAESAARVTAQLAAIADEPAITRVLLDAKVGSAGGGTGRNFDWNAARATLASVNQAAKRPINLVVAGGLRPDNVAEAIQALQPWGVDVASGVEAAPGRKDPLALRRFLENARAQSGAIRPF